MSRTITHRNEYSGQFSTMRVYDAHPEDITATVCHDDCVLEIRIVGRSGVYRDRTIAEVNLGPQGSVKAALAVADAYVSTATLESVRADAAAREAARQAEIAARWAAQPPTAVADTVAAPYGDWDDRMGARSFASRRR